MYIDWSDAVNISLNFLIYCLVNDLTLKSLSLFTLSKQTNNFFLIYEVAKNVKKDKPRVVFAF